uniref:Uncharacterized protein n=1 Tax=Plectus sambesii TaxID=2011161 RepID=A0A914ULQ2_9BILA
MRQGQTRSGKPCVCHYFPRSNLETRASNQSDPEIGFGVPLGVTGAVRGVGESRSDTTQSCGIVDSTLADLETGMRWSARSPSAQSRRRCGPPPPLPIGRFLARSFFVTPQ